MFRPTGHFFEQVLYFNGIFHDELNHVLHELYIVTKSVTVLFSFRSSCRGSSFQLVSKLDRRYSSLTNKSIGNDITVEAMKAYGIQCVLLSVEVMT